jgi:hypothetical protein
MRDDRPESGFVLQKVPWEAGAESVEEQQRI